MNVNIPPHPKGVCWTRQAVNLYDGKVVPGKDPMGREHYWFTVVRLDAAEEGTDRWAVERGYVSMTPLRLDLTHHDELAAARRRHVLPHPSGELKEWGAPVLQAPPLPHLVSGRCRDHRTW